MNISTSDKKYILVGSLAVGGMVAYYCMKNHRKSSKSHIPTIVLPMTPKRTLEESDNIMQILRELESHSTVSFDTPYFHNTDLNSLDHPKESNATDDPIILMAMSDNT
jgi:hypothetical protein